ncbi:MAG: 50S ribosomal protein L17 [Sedimentisphaerales bacterium]|nr:50S ribosomal protein L17 [Sedimentisphaerales bacterium]
MRHQVRGRHLSRTSAHRTALRRNLAASVIEHGTISTTREKAKFVKPFVEKLVTLAKDGSLHARRRAISLLQDRDICAIQDGEPMKVNTVIGKLFSEVGPRFASRNGGYTRIINLPLRRVGDNGQLVLLQLVEETVKAKPQNTVFTTEDAPVSIEPKADANIDAADTTAESSADQTETKDAEAASADQTDEKTGN